MSDGTRRSSTWASPFPLRVPPWVPVGGGGAPGAEPYCRAGSGGGLRRARPPLILRGFLPGGMVGKRAARRGAIPRVRLDPPVAPRRTHGRTFARVCRVGQDPCGAKAARRSADCLSVGRRSRLWRIEGATVGPMATRQHPAQPLAAMSDRAFDLLLEQYVPAPRSRPWPRSWCWCPACRRTVSADRVAWWPSSSRQVPNTFRVSGRRVLRNEALRRRGALPRAASRFYQHAARTSCSATRAVSLGLT
jgi:hypothetical protein